MTVNHALTLVTSRGWLRGFGNLLDNELARWWKTPLWWIVSLVYAALTFFLLNTGGVRNEGMFVYRYRDSVALFHTVGVIVLMQGVLVGDKIDGTVAWVLSKPATRRALILAKLITYSLGVLTTILLMSGAVLYVEWLMLGKVHPNPLLFLKALGIAFLSPMWYLTLMLMLGALLDNRMAILGIGAGLLVLSGKLLSWFPVLRYTLPWYLLSNAATQHPPGGVMMLALGWSIEVYTPTLVILAVECVLFVLVALWRFNREEF
jgi:ABC-type transport system involved in multi-copper enzyme maturation permease subunit